MFKPQKRLDLSEWHLPNFRLWIPTEILDQNFIFRSVIAMTVHLIPIGGEGLATISRWS